MTKDAVLAILRKENDYISGEHISRLLGVSRAAVNTAVKALRADGYEISSSTNKGYHLDAVPNSISAQELAAYLDEARMQTVECLASVDSTNNRLRELALAGAPNGQVVLANEQTQGKGRRGRAFASPQDNGIYLSILFHPDTLPTDIVEITAWTAVATNNAIEEVCGVRAGIKWVNDLVIDRKKICGILTEMGLEKGRIREVVIGDGINVNLEEFPDELKDKATSLYLETGKKYDRNRLISLIMEKFERNYEKFTETCDLSPLIDDYNVMLANRNQPVRILDKINPYEGIAIGIDREGELLVKVADGEIRKVCSGEVSVRGLYSYV